MKSIFALSSLGGLLTVVSSAAIPTPPADDLPISLPTPKPAIATHETTFTTPRLPRYELTPKLGLTTIVSSVTELQQEPGKISAQGACLARHIDLCKMPDKPVALQKLCIFEVLQSKCQVVPLPDQGMVDKVWDLLHESEKQNHSLHTVNDILLAIGRRQSTAIAPYIFPPNHPRYTVSRADESTESGPTEEQSSNESCRMKKFKRCMRQQTPFRDFDLPKMSRCSKEADDLCSKVSLASDATKRPVDATQLPHADLADVNIAERSLKAERQLHDNGNCYATAWQRCQNNYTPTIQCLQDLLTGCRTADSTIESAVTGRASERSLEQVEGHATDYSACHAAVWQKCRRKIPFRTIANFQEINDCISKGVGNCKAKFPGDAFRPIHKPWKKPQLG